jgi:hypothetical protein
MRTSIIVLPFALVACSSHPETLQDTSHPRVEPEDYRMAAGALTSDSAGYIATYGGLIEPPTAKQYVLTAVGDSFVEGNEVDFEPLRYSVGQRWNATNLCSSSGYCDMQTLYNRANPGWHIYTRTDGRLGITRSSQAQVFGFEFNVAFNMGPPYTFGCLGTETGTPSGHTTWSTNCISNRSQIIWPLGFPTAFVANNFIGPSSPTRYMTHGFDNVDGHDTPVNLGLNGENCSFVNPPTACTWQPPQDPTHYNDGRWQLYPGTSSAGSQIAYLGVVTSAVHFLSSQTGTLQNGPTDYEAWSGSLGGGACPTNLVATRSSFTGATLISVFTDHWLASSEAVNCNSIGSGSFWPVIAPLP